jgi:hypothetical protein
MDCPNEHLCETRKVPEGFTYPTDDPLFEFGGSFLGECERHDIPRCKAATFGPEQMHDPLRDNFCLPRAGASNELKIAQIEADRSLL